MTVKNLLRTAVWILPPSAAKNVMLRRLGHAVHPRARAGSNLVWKVDSFELAADSRIGKWNVVKNMRRVKIGPHAMIGRMNLISAHPVYVRVLPDGGVLDVGPHAKIMSRHQLDCSACVTIGEFSSLAGTESRVLTHSVDLTINAQTAEPVRVGERAFVASRALLLGGARLPDRSVLAAGGVLARAKDDDPPSGLYAGVPARWAREVSGAWFGRSEGETRRVVITRNDGVSEHRF